MKAQARNFNKLHSHNTMQIRSNYIKVRVYLEILNYLLISIT